MDGQSSTRPAHNRTVVCTGISTGLVCRRAGGGGGGAPLVCLLFSLWGGGGGPLALSAFWYFGGHLFVHSIVPKTES